MHDCEDFLLSSCVGHRDAFLPLREDSLHAATWLSAEDESSIVVLFEPAVDFMDVFFLSYVVIVVFV